jgi:hypothetical protein
MLSTGRYFRLEEMNSLLFSFAVTAVYENRAVRCEVSTDTRKMGVLLSAVYTRRVTLFTSFYSFLGCAEFCASFMLLCVM